MPDKYEALSREFQGKQNIEITRDGFAVSRAADYIIYSVEAAAIDSVIAQYGPGMTAAPPRTTRLTRCGSNKDGRHRRWPDFVQGPRDQGL